MVYPLRSRITSLPRKIALVGHNPDLSNLTAVRNSDHCDVILNILDIFTLKSNLNFLNFSKILRSKANLQTYNKNSSPDSFTLPHHDFDLDHPDFDFDHYVLLYYVNNSDGDTFLFDDDLNIIKRITPKKGRFLFFNGNILHASSNPLQFEKRIVLNINLSKTSKKTHGKKETRF